MYRFLSFAKSNKAQPKPFQSWPEFHYCALNTVAMVISFSIMMTRHISFLGKKERPFSFFSLFSSSLFTFPTLCVSLSLSPSLSSPQD
jgi:hypothetical protein